MSSLPDEPHDRGGRRPAGQAGNDDARVPGDARRPSDPHGPGHSHGYRTLTGQHRGRLAAVMAISGSIAAAEIAGAIVTGSLVLVADAAHMAADVAGVGLSLLAAHFAARPATERRTYGYARAEILAAMANALLLLGMAAFIFTEAISRIASPPPVSSGLLIGFGIIALVGNAGSLVLLRRGQAESLNVRGAFLEVASDTLGAAAVIITGLIIAATGYTLADPIAAIAVGLLILPRTWQLLREAVDILLETSPADIDLAEIRRHMTGLAGVLEVHDLHVWTITSGLPVLTAHIVVEPDIIASGHGAVMLDRLQDCLRGHFDVAHSTFQLELAGHADHEQPMHE
jgi:cobalt-zinc-cadmium efflux system protein